MKGAWHYWLEDSSTTNTIVEKKVKSDYIPFGLKIYAHTSLSAYTGTTIFKGADGWLGHAEVVITAYGQYTARDSWHTVPILPRVSTTSFSTMPHGSRRRCGFPVAERGAA